MFDRRDFPLQVFDDERFRKFRENRKGVRSSGFQTGLRGFENDLVGFGDEERRVVILCIYDEYIRNGKITHSDFQGFRSGNHVFRAAIFRNELFGNLPIGILDYP